EFGFLFAIVPKFRNSID
ncbi:hypothetical protein MIMGU_mgv11b0241221mg, partial [Erythranthe guttata]